MSAERQDTAAPLWHALDPAELEARLGTGPQGLSQATAAARLAQYGPNQLEETPPPSNLVILLHQFTSPLIVILILAAVITLFLEDSIDAGVIAVALLLNAIIGFTQERRAEYAVRALMQLVAPQARVLREGREWEIASSELVPGDLVLLESGVRVPADIRLIAATALTVDESLLTGESLPAAKRAATLSPAAELVDRENMAYAGAVVSSGRGRGYVTETGMATALGAIAAQVREEPQVQTPLQQRMKHFAHLITLVVGVAAALALGIGILLLGESPAQMFLVAVGMAVAAVPEGLPVVFTITLALGVRRMARRNAIIRRLPAVETLGSTTVIGSDKTGTLTENRMTVQRIWAGGVFYTLTPGSEEELARVLEAGAVAELPEHQALYHTLLTGVLTNEAEIYRTEEDGFESEGDPTEAALLIAAARLGLEPETLRAAYAPYAEIPFEPDRQYSASIREHAGHYLVFVKGAPERVVAMCTRMQGEEEGSSGWYPRQVMEASRELAAAGLRVLAMASGRLAAPPETPESIPEPEGLTFLGLQGMLDPPREGVREAIAGCRAAGIRVIMITGDHALTASAIGRELGIGGDDATVLTGEVLEKMTDAALRAQVGTVDLYARVSPAQKLRVVTALRERGEVIAVTGDGVNDAPALKAADIGVAMGKSGTDVAREAADMVLADDNFVSIYAAVEEGRITFANLRKVTFFLISTGVAAILTLLTALLLRWPLPFVPAQLLWLNLVTNGLQDIALAFEPGDTDVLRHPPRRRQEGILSPLLWERTALAGAVMAVGTLLLFHWELDQTGSLARAQTVALTTMVLFQNFQVWNARSESLSILRTPPFTNPFLFLAVALALVVHVGALYFGATQFILRVVPIEAAAWGRSVATAASIILAMEAHKWLRSASR